MIWNRVQLDTTACAARYQLTATNKWLRQMRFLKNETLLELVFVSRRAWIPSLLPITQVQEQLEIRIKAQERYLEMLQKSAESMAQSGSSWNKNSKEKK
ncbi:hypothetical protein VNO78_15543 [Psophocarpus tetragonolobus]|uniref:Uncharacterized protein n=1 Tax=Psophocarpus tetragonolobus TaxID=3891 RepID=A0AAN9SF64_PSOTE